MYMLCLYVFCPGAKTIISKNLQVKTCKIFVVVTIVKWLLHRGLNSKAAFTPTRYFQEKLLESDFREHLSPIRTNMVICHWTHALGCFSEWPIDHG